MTPNAAFALLLGSLGAFGIETVTSRHTWIRAGTALMALAWVAMTACLILRWSQSGHAPMSNQYESVLFLSWCFLGLYLLFGKDLPVRRPGLWTSIAALLLLSGASLLDRSVKPLVPALQSNWLLLHVSVTMAAYAAFLLNFLSAAACLAHGPSETKSERLASEDFAYRTLSLGFILLSLGIILGSVWANEAWGTYWSWDPKETWSLITWFVYALAMHLRQARGWRGRRFAATSVAGFVCVVFTYFGVNYLMAGLHAYG